MNKEKRRNAYVQGIRRLCRSRSFIYPDVLGHEVGDV